MRITNVPKLDLSGWLIKIWNLLGTVILSAIVVRRKCDAPSSMQWIYVVIFPDDR